MPRLLCLLFPLFSTAFSLDLGGQWSLCSNDHRCWNATVPGDVFSDLHRAGVIPKLLFGDNSLSMGWIARENWTYSRNFSLSEDELNSTQKVMVFNGLDTVSSIRLNGHLILRTYNQFLRHIVNVDKYVKKQNQLVVEFESPVKFAQRRADKYKKRKSHELPPDCPPGVYHGECHPNFIRKAQYSFSWDWGPSMPTVGIWRPITLYAINEPSLLSLSWITEKTTSTWRVTATLEALTVGPPRICTASIGTLANVTFTLSGEHSKTLGNANFTIEIPEKKVELWWPATEGAQILYDFSVICGYSELKEEIGFREVELVQDLIDQTVPEWGRNFYVKVNGRPIFLKGSNWIPASMFPGEDVTERIEFLLDSAVEANMNALRVWGGGVYESEFFYRLANRKGILLWQDFMFACALYPTNTGFLHSVTDEVIQQVTRLRKHPSVMLYAGNNENEIAIRSNWWNPANYSEEAQVRDYLALYQGTIAPLVRTLDTSRPFLLSSPSNGEETEEEGGVAKNPGDPRYGDIHFYNEFIDLWQDYVYMTPRCATEYGVQSMPFKRTMTKWMNESDWHYSSPSLLRRQHHPGGVLSNLLSVFSHFPISPLCSMNDIHRCTSEEHFIDRYAFYSQAHQAIAYKVQTEHYRRFRGKLTNEREGNTMCALYWQLNDVWAAPTWSTVDFNLSWKMAHYEAKRFFAEIIVVLYSTGSDDLAVTVVNDGQLKQENVLLKISQYGWGSKFEPVYSTERNITVEAASAVDVSLNQSQLLDYDSDYVFSAELLSSDGSSIAPLTVLLPDKLYESQLWMSGEVSISQFEIVDSKTYRILLKATDISPFTWLSVDSDVLGWFSDNGFTMLTPSCWISLHLRRAQKITREQLNVCNIRNCGQ